MEPMLLEVRNLKKSFKNGRVKAVDGVSFSIQPGQTVGVVGESGCGKSTLAKLATRLLWPDEGELFLEGRVVDRSGQKGLKDFRRKVQIIFQNPLSSLDPRMRVDSILKEPFWIQSNTAEDLLDGKIDALLKAVELSPELRTRFPHQLSGGESQRVAIARALALEPRLLVCDEAVSSLDAIARGQILNLLLKLQKETHVAYLFISHDLRLVRHMSDEILVMKEGSICESGPASQIFENPKHPTTQALLRAGRRITTPSG